MTDHKGREPIKEIDCNLLSPIKIGDKIGGFTIEELRYIPQSSAFKIGGSYRHTNHWNEWFAKTERGELISLFRASIKKGTVVLNLKTMKKEFFGEKKELIVRKNSGDFSEVFSEFAVNQWDFIKSFTMKDREFLAIEVPERFL